MINKEILRRIVNNDYVDDAYKDNLFFFFLNELKDFITILNDKNLLELKMYRKVIINKCEFSKILFDNELFNLFSKYFDYYFKNNYEFIEFLIQFYKMNCNYLYDLNNNLKNVYRKVYFQEMENKILDPTKYILFDKLIKNGSINTDDLYLVGFNCKDNYEVEKMQEVYAEYLIYKKIYKDIENKEVNYNELRELHDRKDDLYNYRWLSFFDGDGYGADLLFTMKDLKKEELHEVKKRLPKYDGTYEVNVTDNEKNIIDEVRNYNNVDYFIDVVLMTNEWGRRVYNYDILKFKLNKENGYFVNNKNDIYSLEKASKGYTLKYINLH